MACSELDQKFLGQLAKNVAGDNARLSSMLFKILGLSVMLSKELLHARKLGKLDPTYATKAPDLYFHIIWLAREGLVMVEQYVLPMVANFGELKVLSSKLRASFYHIFVLFYNRPSLNQTAAQKSTKTHSKLALPQPEKANKGKAPDRGGMAQVESSRSSVHPPIPTGYGPLGDTEISKHKVQPAADFLLSARDYIPTALACFRQASDLAKRLLWGSHPLRLSVNLEFSAFLYDCMHDGQASRRLAKATIREVYSAQESMDDEMFKDAAEIVSVLGRMVGLGLEFGTPGDKPDTSGGTSNDKGWASKSTPIVGSTGFGGGGSGGDGGSQIVQQKTPGTEGMMYIGLLYDINKRRMEPDWITYQWEIPEAMNLRLGKEGHQISFAETLRTTVVLTEYNCHVEATTCEGYMKREWGDLGLELLELIISGLLRSPKSRIVGYWIRNFSADPNELSILFQPDLSNTDRRSVIEALAWLCQAIRIPVPGRLSASSSDSQLLHAHIKDSRVHQGHFQGSNEQTTSSQSELQLSFQLQGLSPFLQPPDLCWWPLFKSGVVAIRSCGQKLKSSNNASSRGLEVSFELMVQIAAVEIPVLVDEGIVLVGYQTALVPISASDNSIQWHLEIREEGQINPYELKSTQRAWFKHRDWKSFTNMRCFVGWCPFVHINLGTSVLSEKVGWSDSKSRKRTLRWSGISFGGQATTANPMQIGLSMQANFSFVSNKVNFTPTDSFAKLLKDTSKEVAAIIDCLGGRSWLAPKLSLMLHMAHAWSARNSIDPDPIPYAKPCHDGSQAEKALRDSGNIALLGQGLDTFTLRQLMLGLNVNLYQSRHQTEDSRSGKLFGFEFMDIVCQPPMGGSMKRVSIKSQGKCWLSIVNMADAVVVCANLGQAIMPVDENNQRNPNCNILPRDSDFLAVPLSCLTELIERQGWQGSNLDGKQKQSFKISEDHFWKISGNPFEDCIHKGQNAHTCWERDNLLQRVTKRGTLYSIFKDSNQIHTCGALYPYEGAVVFGERPVRIEILSI